MVARCIAQVISNLDFDVGYLLASTLLGPAFLVRTNAADVGKVVMAKEIAKHWATALRIMTDLQSFLLKSHLKDAQHPHSLRRRLLDGFGSLPSLMCMASLVFFSSRVP